MKPRRLSPTNTTANEWTEEINENVSKNLASLGASFKFRICVVSRLRNKMKIDGKVY